MFTLPNKKTLSATSCTDYANIHTADQLERLARAGNNGPTAEENQTRQSLRQGLDDFMFTNEHYPTQSSAATHGQDQPQPNPLFTDLISEGIFEQKPAPEVVLFLYGASLNYYSSNLTQMQDKYLLP